MAPIFTGKGDDGTTGLLGEGRLPKHALLMETLGTLDEASAALGMARAVSLAAQVQEVLAEAQRDLYNLMAELASDIETAERFRKLDMRRVAWLETEIRRLEATVALPRGFILPGDSPAGAALALARTVVRRAERRVSELVAAGETDNPALLPYMNRLSSLCFILEIEANQSAGKSTSTAKVGE